MDEMIMVDLYPLFHEARCDGIDYGQSFFGELQEREKVNCQTYIQGG